jgi:DNA-binding MltR family transcriptional regulator
VVRVKAFDETETLAAFQALHAANPKSPITLLFTIDKPFQKATLMLKNEAKEIPLSKSAVEVLSED